MAFKKLDPIANGNYVDYVVSGGTMDGWEAVSDTLHNTATAPGIGTLPDTAKESYKFAEIPSDVPGITPIDRVELFYEPLTVGGFETGPGLTVKHLSRYSGTDLLGPDKAPVVDYVVGGASAIKSHIFPTAPGGAAWTVAHLQGVSRAEFGMEVAQVAGSQSTVPLDAKLWLEVDYRAIPPNFDAARSVASRILRLRRRLCFVYEVGVPLWMLDAELLSSVTMSYLAADDPKGQGWLYRSWERGWLKLLEVTLNRNRRELSHKYFFMREYACLFWDTMISESSAGLYGLGCARLGLGQARTFDRDSGAWIKSSTGTKRGALYYLATNHVEKITELGTLLFSARTNELLHSSFIQGVLPALTGWTFEGTGGGNTVAGEDIPSTGPRLFVEEVGGRRVKIVKGTAAEVQARNTTLVSIANNANFWVNIGHLDTDSTKPLKWAARRIVGGNTYWWNNAGQTWGSAGGAKVWNALTGKSTDVIVDFYKIPFGALGAGTVEVMLGFDSAASNTTSYGYHAEVIEAEYLSEELIVSTTVAYTVLVDQLSDANDSGTPAESKRIMPASGFTWSGVIQPLWNAADVGASGIRVVFNNRFDANNYIILFWNKDTGQLICRYRRAGTAYDAVKTLSVVKGTQYRLAVRVIGAAGEEDMSPYTVSLFVDGVKGTDVTPAAVITMTSTGTLWRGTDQGTNALDGYMSNFEVTHEVLSDEEIKGLP